MRQEIATKWTELLRSGEFAQGKNALRDTDDKYCCLGVLCEMAVREGVISSRLPFASSDYYAYGTANGDDFNISVLPDVVREWAGMFTSTGESSNGSLSALNDGGMEFAEIADLIDAEYATL